MEGEVEREMEREDPNAARDEPGARVRVDASAPGGTPGDVGSRREAPRLPAGIDPADNDSRTVPGTGTQDEMLRVLGATGC